MNNSTIALDPNQFSRDNPSMGLTIYYSLKAKATPDAARGIVARMHQAISKLPWDKVSQVFELGSA